MTMYRPCSRDTALFLLIGVAFILQPVAAQAQEMCGGQTYPFPYADVASVGAAFCPGIMEAYVTGVSKGTTPTTFSPDETVTRVQMTTFLQRSLDQGLTRATRRTALKQVWQANLDPQVVAVGGNPIFCAADGENIWVSNIGSVVQVRASTGQILGTWTGASLSWPIVAIPGAIFTASNANGLPPASIYYIDPSQPPGPASDIGEDGSPSGFSGMAFDGANLWIADFSGSVDILNITGAIINTSSNVSTGFNEPVGLVFDGTHMWVTDFAAGTLLQLDSTGAILKTVPVGTGPEQPAFDGENIWVPNYASSSITVVQASTGNVVATIDHDGSNGLSKPEQASFDGERILVTNTGGNDVSIFKAADLSLIATFSTGDGTPYGACSDGVNFWVTLSSAGNLLKF